MSILIQCNENDPGAKRHTYQCWVGEGKPTEERPYWLREIAQNRVLSRSEQYMGDGDYDYYALYWNDETNAPELVCTGTTRGGSFGGTLSIDADEPTKAKYLQWCIAQDLEEAKRDNVAQAQEVAPGKRCVVVKGRKWPKGMECTVRRVGEPQKYSVSRWAIATTPVLVEYANGEGIVTQGWVPNIENLQVLAWEQYLKPESALLDCVTRCNQQGRRYMGEGLARLIRANPNVIRAL